MEINFTTITPMWNSDVRYYSDTVWLKTTRIVAKITDFFPTFDDEDLALEDNETAAMKLDFVKPSSCSCEYYDSAKDMEVRSNATFGTVLIGYVHSIFPFIDPSKAVKQ